MDLLLYLGIIIFFMTHTLPAAYPKAREEMIQSLGKKIYLAIFALESAAGIFLMIYGWRLSVPEHVYTPPEWGNQAAIILMFAAFILFLTSNMKSNLQRLLRHPQLSGVALWAVAHLLANGDDRSLLLFGSLGLWSVIEMHLLNRRDGDWQKPQKRPLSADLKPVLAGVVVCSVVWGLHVYISGVEVGF